MAIPINSGKSKTYSEQEILVYVDRVIKEAPLDKYFRPSDFFTMYEFPPYIEIKQRMFSLGYIKHNTKVTYKLTDRGIEAKKAGGHFEFEKLESFKKKRSDEKEHYDFINSLTDAKTKWIMILIGIIAVLITALAMK